MPLAVLPLAAAVLLIGPTVIAFDSGGYFDGPRMVGALVAWVLVLVAAVASRVPLPVSRAGRATLAGLVLILLWTGASVTWAPLRSAAMESVTRLILYLGTLVAAAALLRERRALRAVEPALAFGSLVVIGYGLAGRLLPGLVELDHSQRAGGRLEQPITYWNAEGALAAIGLVLCARIAGDRSRPTWLRALAAAGWAPLGLGVYLSYSRGAIAAGLMGLLVLLAAAPDRAQLRAVAGAVAAGVAAGVCSVPLRGVAALEGSAHRRSLEGLAMLMVLGVLTCGAALLQRRAALAESRGQIGVARLGIARRLPAVAAAAVALSLAGLVAGGLGERGGDHDQLAQRKGASRLGSVDSRRYDYWRVGVAAFGDHPLNGVGAGGFRVEWLRERPVDEGVVDVHSLELEMASDLGLVGLLCFGLFLGGGLAAGRQALRRNAPAAAGLCAGLTVWLLHATIDWDWQVPAVTLPALIMLGALIAAGEAPAPEQPPGARSRRTRRDRAPSAATA